MKTWKELPFWNTGEWQGAEERLRDLTKAKKVYCPGRKNLFASLSATPLEDVRVVFVGQDPYPDPKYATGLAFSIPPEEKKYPPTLQAIFHEYETDLHLEAPRACGSLLPWAKEGVLLWNAIPSCLEGQSLSHDWGHWFYLNQDVFKAASDRGCVFVFFGGYARGYSYMVRNLSNCVTLEVSHPSPRASIRAKDPFIGSRIFSRTNDALNSLKLGSINWRL